MSALTDLVSCPTCGLSEFKELDDSKEFPAVKCKQCGLGIEKYVYVVPSQYHSQAYALSRDSRDLPKASNNVNVPSLRWHHDVAVAHMRMEQLAKYLHKGNNSWLDIGCGSGAMLSAASSKGYEVLGVDVNVDHLEYPAISAHDWLSGKMIHDCAVVVSFFDSLEHVIDPVRYLQTANLHLGQTSTLVIEVPDLDQTADFKIWKHRRITKFFTEHIWHFNSLSLGAMVNKYVPGLKVVHVGAPVPGKLQMVWKQKGGTS